MRVDPAATVLYIEKGHAEPEELAAIAAVLLAYKAAESDTGPTRTRSGSKATWRRFDRAMAFLAPHSWQG
ncbi:acyl-CoA carboxylase subunit epsilon [Streptomyces lunaelactis]|uniref:acyl-CoA carboxylase epsilon subunit n=1 Tax=Streptomyces lunaelactis TaxID=1535768 RepID=UPI0015855D31|nr:acyl-CoA carboxylase epsilon subunit [Streptomyces lunaelactis]NUK01354.1 acyl-CoA carboxylase subunit epsilon [Streptomyces lunaelactis]NUK08752.1 acyl-CoA carboxylase subunit epsilon [Streptomyces lunaelactis]NUK15335.1 acyl-CoA carboxylase subunit epsilon [Streptomyces lunaelactis]NUK22508.1 acyl-CoA carboxylase subunit epsilon [Streptomyces lunaelactis]NUK32646.1 acyl-CoA carboxylase subunit epsilon [Streptomyces lunaelactis]